MPEHEALRKLRSMLGIDGAHEDGVLRFIIRRTESLILSYINHKSLPPELWHVLIAMAADYYKSEAAGLPRSGDFAVKSVRRGDVTTTFETTSIHTRQDDFFGWKTILNEFRRVRW